MTSFAPNDKVLFDNGPGYVGTIAGRHGGGWTVTFTPGSSGAWLCLGNLTKLAADTPVYRTGTTVQVRCDTPHHAGRRGQICGAEIRGDLFGYLLQLGETKPVWVPAAVLIPVEGGVAR